MYPDLASSVTSLLGIGTKTGGEAMMTRGRNAKATLRREAWGEPPTEAGRYFQVSTEDVATGVKEAMSRRTEVEVTSPLELSDTSKTTIPFAMLPTGNWTSLADATSAGLKDVCASVERAHQTKREVIAKIDGRFFISNDRNRILAGHRKILMGKFRFRGSCPKSFANAQNFAEMYLSRAAERKPASSGGRAK
jgi:hypothetical protein